MKAVDLKKLNDAEIKAYIDNKYPAGDSTKWVDAGDWKYFDKVVGGQARYEERGSRERNSNDELIEDVEKKKK